MPVEENKITRNFRNIVVLIFLHILMIYASIWLSGFLTAYLIQDVSRDINLIGLNLNAIYIFQKWSIWLYKSWSALSINSYNNLKIKLIVGLSCINLIVLILYIFNAKKIMSIKIYREKEAVFGDSRWATQEDVKRSGLRSKDGMLLGKDEGGYFVAEGFQHALLFAPTGSGKGVGFVIPNLLFWTHSVIVHDIKLENYELTSGWRQKQGQECYVWEPANPDGITHCYNPIDWISAKPGQMVDDVQKLGNLILTEKDFWNNEARSLFLGVMLYIIADPAKPKSFGEVVRTLRSDDVVYSLAVALDTLGAVMHPVGYMNIAAALQKPDKERGSVISTLNSGLELWANPLIDSATASSDFNFQNLKKQRTTIYVGLTPDNISRLQKLMQIFYQQATEFLSRKMPNLKEEPYGVLFLMDEFPTLGKMEQFKAGIAYFRGYRVRLFLIIQDTQQLKGTYEEAGMNSFLSNSTFRITFAANNYETANLISQLCGNKTVKQESYSKPKFFDLNPSTRTTNVSEVQRALLLPQEVIQLSRDEQIVLIESFPPIRSKKIKYFEDKTFTERLLPKTFVPTQEPFDIRKFNAKTQQNNSENDDSPSDEDTNLTDENDENIENSSEENIVEEKNNQPSTENENKENNEADYDFSDLDGNVENKG